MSDQFIERAFEENHLILTLNRPDKLNSFTKQMALDLQSALNDAAQNNGVRSVILTGSGRAFCAGQDLSETLENDKLEDYQLGDTVRSCYNPIIQQLQTMPKPVIAAVNGTAAGAGANLAFACDFLIVAEEAKFIQSFSQIGLIPDSGGTYILPRMLGYHRALELMMLGEPISAAQAKDWGIVREITPNNELMTRANQFAQKLAQMPTQSLGYIKQALRESYKNSLSEQLELEARLQSKAGDSRDYQEGVQAFLEKRSPDFKGC